MEERRKACEKANEVFNQMMAGGDYDMELAKEFYEKMCEDITSERKRIGGDCCRHYEERLERLHQVSLI